MSSLANHFFHDKVGKDYAPALHLLLFHYVIATAEEKGPGGDGGVGGENPRVGRAFQSVAQGGGHPPALVLVVDIEPIQIAGVVHVGEADDLAIQLGHQSAVGQKGGVPGGEVCGAGRPGVQLLLGIVGGADGVDGSVEQPGDGGAVGGNIGTDAKIGL